MSNVKTSRVNDVLIVRDESANVEMLSRLFENNGFPVTVTSEDVLLDDAERYGAIAHVAFSVDLLDERLGDRLETIKDEEWILIAGDDDYDLHCTVELTVHASISLRLFIQSLWSRFCVP